jgi:phenylalanyl-tRNA synthetase beta chain
MKFSEQWLREWVNPSVLTTELTEKLTMAGLEVDSIDPVAAKFTQVVVGKVLSIEPHPNADKLQVCQVQISNQESSNCNHVQIVCGASNVKVNMLVPTALVGAKLPKINIKQAKLRDVESNGMLCSEAELGLAESANGLMPLPIDAPIGENIRDYLKLEDVSIDVDLTPNRGDCLSIMGIAREVGTLYNCPVNSPSINSVNPEINDIFPVEILAKEACPNYIGRLIKNINIKALTPLWMTEKLRRSGIRSINPVVDVTNFVLLELGQPMHAFDLDKLDSKICVRMANNQEKITLLDGQIIELDNDTLVIADNKQAQALAGIMGGADSAVNNDTQNIFLESAFFTPLNLAGCARRYKLHTDSSHRFERGVDPKLQIKAIERATSLLLDICGGQASKIIEQSQLAVDNSPKIILRKSRIKRLLGKKIASNNIEEYLTRLEMTCKIIDNDSWEVIPPSFRFDIKLEADLIEEIARIFGYNNLPMNTGKTSFNIKNLADNSIDKIRNILVSRAYQEAITYSFVDDSLQNKLNSQNAIKLANPLAKELATMRTTLWTGLLNAVQYNYKRQQTIVRLFETGLSFIPSANEIKQENMLAGVITGNIYPEQWGMPKRAVDFFDLKADVEALLKISNKNFSFKPTKHQALHPEQAAKIIYQDKSIGLIGALHPSIAKDLDLPATFIFEIELDIFKREDIINYKLLSKYPSMRRDIAILINKDILVGDIKSWLKQNAGELLVDLQLFDIYEGKGIDENQKSLAFSLIFRNSSRNLIEDEIDNIINKLLDGLKVNFSAILRL